MRCESMREAIATETFFRDKKKASTVVCGGEKDLFGGGPGSEIRI